MNMHVDPRHTRRQRTRSTLLGHTSRGGVRPRQPAVAAVLAGQAADAAQRQAEIEQDLRLARDIQQGLLLEAVPRWPGWEISAVSLPARAIGGDLYDFLALGGCQQGIM